MVRVVCFSFTIAGFYLMVMVNCLFNVTIYNISVIYVTAHRWAGGLKKKLDLRSGSKRHRHFAGFFNVPVLAPTPYRGHRKESQGCRWLVFLLL